ncbi:MAG: cyclic nucleotide-binding domain-containing protein [Gammaproteobacteria bacterium]|jgi:signal-transduction protein with cAMP-binding, CBS, and nucleotidyltransferase domain|nr:cyclic nucleotide-binding domain-containing protein [Gammaproteobacteria bacterium]
MQQINLAEFSQVMAPEDMALGSVFGALTIDATHFLLEKGSLYRLAQGDKVFEYGDAGGRFFVVCKGSLDFFKQHQGEWRHIRVVNFGEETGFVPMIALHEQSGTAVAREDSIVLEISSALYAELQQKYSVDFGLLTLNLAREMARVIDKMGEAMVTKDK